MKKHLMKFEVVTKVLFLYSAVLKLQALWTFRFVFITQYHHGGA